MHLLFATFSFHNLRLFFSMPFNCAHSLIMTTRMTAKIFQILQAGSNTLTTLVLKQTKQ